jgi:hypothetical protein
MNQAQSKCYTVVDGIPFSEELFSERSLLAIEIA